MLLEEIKEYNKETQKTGLLNTLRYLTILDVVIACDAMVQGATKIATRILPSNITHNKVR
ncbi:MAG: hypothetical protein LBU87_06315 [Lactobacillales bacterium]|nr:hypothetical protein [Lactobacillales bacterium]